MKKILAIASLVGAAFLLFKTSVLTAPQGRGTASLVEASLMSNAPMARPVTSRAEAEPVSGASSLARADDFLKRHRDEMRLQPYHDLRGEAYDSIVGSRVVYRAYQDGLPIIGMEIEIAIDSDSRARLVRNDYRPVKRIDLSSLHVLPVGEILNQGSDRFGAPMTSSAPASVLYLSPTSDEPDLAYAVSFHGKGPRAHGIQALLRATDGQLLARTSSRSEF